MNGPKTNSDHCTPEAEVSSDLDGFMRLKDIIAPRGPIPVGKSTFWARVKDGSFPKPYKLGRGITVWRRKDIRDLIQRTTADGSSPQQIKANR